LEEEAGRYDRFTRRFTPTGVYETFDRRVCWPCSPAYAKTARTQGTRINLDARASEEVDNMRATLFVEMEDIDAAKSREVKQASNAAKMAKGFAGLQVRTSGYPHLSRDGRTRSRAGGRVPNFRA
jgi:hypothetical protein